MNIESPIPTLTIDMSRSDTVRLVHNMIGYVTATRRGGSTYIHAWVRDNARFAFDVAPATCDGRDVRLSYCSYGRSWQGGGHKSKAHAVYVDTGKPVPSKFLAQVIAA